ncbi:MAG: hypothetical protein GY943_39410 [Chloroflexi bacterium]|nr:hypothetical protein [Chloroflexota bacterium]
MNIKQILQKQLGQPILIVLLLLLTACGTFEVALDPDMAQIESVAASSTDSMVVSESPPDNAPAPTTPTPLPAASGMLELMTYVHPEWGYQISIPNAAMIDEGYSDTLFIRQDNNEHLLLGVGVSVSANTHWEEWEVTTPEEMLQYQAAGTADSIFEVIADNGNLVGAGTVVERNGRFGSAVCEKVVEQHMAFIVDEKGYSLSIMADAPGRCDVTKLAETAQIINSFRILSTAVSEPIPDTSAITPSFMEVGTYQDEDAGFELDYPASWTADSPQVVGSRGNIANITSWERPPGELFETVPANGTFMSVGVYLWDPKNDLDAYIATRKQAWSASGFDIVLEKELTLGEDWRAVRFMITTPEELTFFLTTTIGERYLVLSGSGDLDMLMEIAQTLRPLE